MDSSQKSSQLQYSISAESIRDRHGNEYNITLSYRECCALADSHAFHQIPISMVWKRQHSFGEKLGFSAQEKTQDVLYSVICDAIIAHDLGTYVHYPRSKSMNKACLGMGHGRLMTALKFLTENELVVNYIVPSGSNNPIRSFFGATPKLVECCALDIRQDQLQMDSSVWNTYCTYREHSDADSKSALNLRYRAKLDTLETRQSTKDLDDQNRFLQSSKIGFSPPPEKLIRIASPFVEFKNYKSKVSRLNTAEVVQKRIFVRDSERQADLFGGRLYGGFWQRLCKEDRRHITFSGEFAGKEIDFRALHVDFAYSLVNGVMPDDPYHAECRILAGLREDLKRKVVKKALLIAFNAKSLVSAAGALASLFMVENSSLYGVIKPNGASLGGITPNNVTQAASQIIKATIEYNLPIKNYICQDMGVRFQRVDSEIMMATQNRCRAEDIPVLGVHDSVLSPQSKSERVKVIFYEELGKAKKRLREGGLCSYEIDCPSA